MNKNGKCLIFMVLSLVLCKPLFSQDKILNHSFQLRPLVFLSNILGSVLDDDSEAYSFELSFEYQYAINNYINIFFAPFFSMGNNKRMESYSFWGGWNSGFITETIEYYIKEISYGFDPGIIIRPFGRRLKGFYIKPYSKIGFNHIIVSDYDINDTNFAIGIMGELGYQWILKNGFTIALGGGVGKDWIIPFENNKAEYRENNFPIINLNFGLGYSF